MAAARTILSGSGVNSANAHHVNVGKRRMAQIKNPYKVVGAARGGARSGAGAAYGNKGINITASAQAGGMMVARRNVKSGVARAARKTANESGGVSS